MNRSGRYGRSQRERVLDALRVAGRGGVAMVDFLAPDVLDGGRPIVRLASRVDELRQAGHAIETRRAPNRTALYVLRREAPVPAREGAPETPGSAALFDAPGDKPSSPYDQGEWS